MRTGLDSFRIYRFSEYPRSKHFKLKTKSEIFDTKAIMIQSLIKKLNENINSHIAEMKNKRRRKATYFIDSLQAKLKANKQK